MVRTWFLVLGIVTLGWGVALWVTDDGGSTLVWAWPGDVLSSRLIGVMVITIGAGALASLRSREAAPMMLAVATTYGLMVALASIWQSFLDAPVREGYVVMFGAIGLISLGLLALTLTRSRRPEATV
jgi:hypothetical protein